MSELLDSAGAWIAANPGWSGLLVFLTAMTESLTVVGLIVPGAALMVGFGALIALGHLDFLPVFAWAVAGAIVGDGLSFWLGRVLQSRLRLVWPFRRHPHWLQRGEDYFLRHGGKSILFGRFFGPVRAVVPAVAGMLGMPTRRFLAVNCASALLWAPAYLLPGMLIGASLELASQVATSLVLLLVVLLALLWLTVSAVRTSAALLQPHVGAWVRSFSEWSRRHPLVAPYSASLLDPERGEFRGLMAAGLLLLVSPVLVSRLAAAIGGKLPTPLDQSVALGLEALRTPWGDALLAAVATAAQPATYLVIALSVALWLLAWGRRVAAVHWAVGLALAIGLQWLLQRLFVDAPTSDPAGLPGGATVIATTLYGLLATLVARELPPQRRWLAYLAAAMLVVPQVFASLYLGQRWLSDAVAGTSLGLCWVTLLGLGYAHHADRPMGWGAPAVALVALLASTAHGYSTGAANRLAASPPPRLVDLPASDWIGGSWQTLPPRRSDLQGAGRQRFVLQWAAEAGDIEAALARHGWTRPEPLGAVGALRAFEPGVGLGQLPVLPRIHAGRPQHLTLQRIDGDRRWLLRLWDSDYRLRPGAVPVWLGMLTVQHAERRFMGLLTLPADLQGETPLGGCTTAAALLGALGDPPATCRRTGPLTGIWLIGEATRTD